MRVAVASTLGASADAGVRAPSGGPVDVSVAGPLTPGAVIEAWVRSEPRLVAAAAVPEDYEEGDAVTFTVPLATPLDGGEAVEDGDHTLELRMYTEDGFEVVAPLQHGPAGAGHLGGQQDLLAVHGHQRSLPDSGAEGAAVAGARARRRQASEQNFTASQSRAHFRRQAKGRAQAAQGLEGRSDFRTILGMTSSR